MRIFVSVKIVRAHVGVQCNVGNHLFPSCPRLGVNRQWVILATNHPYTKHSKLSKTVCINWIPNYHMAQSLPILSYKALLCKGMSRIACGNISMLVEQYSVSRHSIPCVLLQNMRISTLHMTTWSFHTLEVVGKGGTAAIQACYYT